jgi:hypothetical protein
MEEDAMDDVTQMIAKLRQLSPHRVRVYADADNYKDVAVPQRRKRWAQVVATIESLQWVRCELLDKSGALLGTIENAATELEAIPTEPAGAAATANRWFLEMMIRAQTVALQFRDKEHVAILQTMRELLDLNMQNTRDMHTLMRAQRDEAMELARVKAMAEQGSDIDQIVKLIEVSPHLMQALGPLLGMLTRKKIAAAAPNGKAS